MERLEPRICTVGRIVFVRVLRPSDAETLVPQTREITLAFKKLGRPLWACQLSDETVPTPDRKQQEEASIAISEWFRMIDGLHLVLEGDGVRHMVTRMMVRTLLATSKLGNKVFGVGEASNARNTYMHDSLESMLTSMRAQLVTPVSEIRTTLRQHGLIRTSGQHASAASMSSLG